jgi:hypothetical protein
MELRALVDEFANRLQALIEHEVLERARAAVHGASMAVVLGAR